MWERQAASIFRPTHEWWWVFRVSHTGLINRAARRAFGLEVELMTRRARRTFGRLYAQDYLLSRSRRVIYDRSRFVVVGPSHWMTDQASRSPVLNRQMKVRVPNGVDLTVYAPGDSRRARAELGMPSDGSVILFVGKPDSIQAYSERIPMLVASLEALVASEEVQRDRVHLLLVGEGARTLAARLPFAAHCAGGVSDDAKMAQCYAAADLLLTTTQYDNYPGVVQEALASGRPVVASRVGGVPELVQQGVTGWLCNPTQPVEFAAALAQALAHPRECAAMGRRSREFAASEFEQTAVVSRTVDLYKETIAARGGGG